MGEAKQKHDAGQVQRVIDFMGQRKTALVFSIVMVVSSILSLAVNGLQFGLDFTGGLQIELKFEQAADLPLIRSSLTDTGVEDATVVFFGSDKDIKITTQQNRESLIRALLASSIDGLTNDGVQLQTVTPRKDDRLPEGGIILTVAGDLADQVDRKLIAYQLESYLSVSSNGRHEFLTKDGVQVLAEKLLLEQLAAATDDDLVIKRTEFVGPQIGDELRDQGGIGMLFALAVVMVYVALRFQYKFSVGAVAALVHDVIIVLGFFSILHLDFDLTVLAAVLAVIGYSLNDTIVVSDRIRENFRKVRKSSPVEIINISLSQTLGRTLVTSLTTLLVLLALFFVGGELIHSFSIALIIGIVIGTYSSIYVAANTLLMMHITKEDLMVPEKEGAELEELP